MLRATTSLRPFPQRPPPSAPAASNSPLIPRISGRTSPQAFSKSFPTADTRSPHSRKEGGATRPGGPAGSLPSFSYPSRVGSPNGGLTITAKKGTFHSTGVSRSPYPSTRAGRPIVKNGTSAPPPAPRESSFSGEGDFPVRAINPF